jgi:hypothetical protein
MKWNPTARALMYIHGRHVIIIFIIIITTSPTITFVMHRAVRQVRVACRKCQPFASSSAPRAVIVEAPISAIDDSNVQTSNEPLLSDAASNGPADVTLAPSSKPTRSVPLSCLDQL